MAAIVTLTMNPAIDLSTSVDEVVPVRKLRCAGLRRDPGGGGINVARVVRRMGAPVTAIYMAGGSVGRLLRTLVEQAGIESLALGIAAETREDFTVHEEATGHNFASSWPVRSSSKASGAPAWTGFRRSIRSRIIWWRAAVCRRACPMISTGGSRGSRISVTGGLSSIRRAQP